MKNIIIGADHRGFVLKSKLIEHLELQKYLVKDVGCFSTDSANYPEVVKAAQSHMLTPVEHRGILICGSGIGMSIAANRYPQIRAALCWNEGLARSARMHNNSNVLVLAADFTDTKQAITMLDAWLNTEFEGGRHQIRVNMLDAE